MQISHSYDVDALVRRTRLEARPYQKRIVTKALNMFGGHYKNGAGENIGEVDSVMIESPTGSGKTPMALLTLKAIQEETDADIVWVSMRRNLLRQAACENADPSPGNPDGKGINARICFMSMFTREVPEELLPGRRTRPLIVMHDEAQHDVASSAQHLHNELKPEKVLGASATPYRTDSVKLPFEMVIRDAGIHELIQGNYLSEYHQYCINDWDPITVADMYAMDPERWGSSLMFFNDLTRCRACLDRLNGHYGLRFDLVTGNSDREDQIEALRQNELDGLINCAVLTEGFNFPDLKTVWVRDSGKGCTIQMGGRIFRKSRLHQYKQVVQSKQTDHPMPRTATPRMEFVWQSNSWRSLKSNPMIDQQADETVSALAGLEDEVPQFIKDRLSGKRRSKKF